MEQQQTAEVIDITPRLEDDHLAREHGLVPVKAYVKDEARAEKRTANAERVARHREKKKAAGLVQVDLPAELAEAIKLRGLDQVLDQVRGSGPREVVKEVVVEKPVEIVREVLKVERVEVPVERVVEKPVPAKLSKDQSRLIELGRAVESLPGWKRKILEWLGV